ncbi:MAG: sialidase family protein [Victivallales bacterium]
MITNEEITKLWAGKNYFQPAICRSGDGILFMTLQELFAADTFGSPSCSFSTDDGLTWSEPEVIDAFRTTRFDDGKEETIADVRPYFHPKSGMIIVIGCNTWHHRGDDGLLRHGEGKGIKKEKQYPVYAVRDAGGKWSERKLLAHSFFTDCSDCRTANFQLVIEPGGDLLIPVYFNLPGKNIYSVCVVRCSFDGGVLAIKKISDVLSLEIGRGLIEPSLCCFQGKYHLTIRAEDGHGYHSTSSDGLSWGGLTPWSWDNGQALVTSSTQQHWLVAGSHLYLFYVRKDKTNENVVRWRTPLFMSEVDPIRGCLIKDSEEIVFPLLKIDAKPNSMGNFHVALIENGTALVSEAPLWLQIEYGAKREDDRLVGIYSEVWIKKIIYRDRQ